MQQHTCVLLLQERVDKHMYDAATERSMKYRDAILKKIEFPSIKYNLHFVHGK